MSCLVRSGWLAIYGSPPGVEGITGASREYEAAGTVQGLVERPRQSPFEHERVQRVSGLRLYHVKAGRSMELSGLRLCPRLKYGGGLFPSGFLTGGHYLEFSRDSTSRSYLLNGRSLIEVVVSTPEL
jgi:hypothetical protein